MDRPFRLESRTNAQDIVSLTISRDSSAILQESPRPEFLPMTTKPPVVMSQKRVLGTLGVVAITYFYGCGGPIGTEPVVVAGGPLVAMIALLVYPLVMSLPYAWIVAELCSAFPEDGGFAIWVLHAFGPFWACQVGYWSWVSGLVVGAFIPGLFVSIADKYLGLSVESALSTYLLKVAIALVLAIPSILGTKFVSRLTITLLVVTLVPYVIFTIWAYSRTHDFDDLSNVRHQNTTYDAEENEAILSGPVDIDWATLINTLFWNYDGINIASVFGGEVQNPARVYSRAIFFTFALSTATTFIPMPAAVVGGSLHWTQFQVGSYSMVAEEVGGKFLQVLIVFSAVGTLGGLYICSLYGKAYEISGMADSNLVHRVFSKRNAMFNSPHMGVLVSVAGIIPLTHFSYTQLLPIGNAFACAVELMILLSVIRLRYTLPFVPRPTKVPGGVKVLMFVAIFPAIVLAFIMYNVLINEVERLVVLACFVPGLFYGVYQAYERHEALR